MLVYDYRYRPGRHTLTYKGYLFEWVEGAERVAVSFFGRVIQHIPVKWGTGTDVEKELVTIAVDELGD